MQKRKEDVFLDKLTSDGYIGIYQIALLYIFKTVHNENQKQSTAVSQWQVIFQMSTLVLTFNLP